jgi:hypothetical protein
MAGTMRLVLLLCMDITKVALMRASLKWAPPMMRNYNE